jgi:hypothetical protein
MRRTNSSSGVGNSKVNFSSIQYTIFRQIGTSAKEG